MFNYIYSYVCPECNSELEFKSMYKASDEVQCMCKAYMELIRYWAYRAYPDH